MDSRAMLARAHQTVGPAAAVKNLTDDVALQFILADVPFFTVGVFALGVFTFRMFMRRCKWSTICLLGSAFMAFAAAILDLVQTLGRNGKLIDATANLNPFLQIIIVREVCYAVSFGLRYLWFWVFVACSPPGSLPSEGGEMHSGSWERWGYIGLALRWALMPAILGMTSLQIIYRIYTPLAKYGPVYEVEGALQVVLSAVFVLKLLLNVYLVALDQPGLSSRRQTLLRYLPIFVALLISLAVGVGNILEFLFSETVLGRFLQAVELYAVILYTLVAAFYHLKNVPIQATDETRRKRSSSFQSPAGPFDSTYGIPQPRLSSADLISAFQRRNSNPQERQSGTFLDRSTSYTRRMSNWFPRRPSRQNAPPLSTPAEERVFQPQNMATGPYETEVKRPRPSYDRNSPQPILHQSIASKAAAPLQRISSAPRGILSTTGTETLATSGIPQAARVRFPDVGLKEPLPPPPPVMTAVQVRTESPIYGLSGIINANRVAALARDDSHEEEDPRTYFDNTPRSSGISGLIRQQEELDKSIDALKLFDAATVSEVASSRRASPSPVAGRPTSPSKSEFSLSNFPEPPWGRSSTDTASIYPPGLPSSDVNLDTLPRPPPVFMTGHRSRQQSVPTSESGDALAPPARNRTTSEGTQYEITSFIGNLTQPGNRQPGSSLSSDPNATSSFSGGNLQAIAENPLSPGQISGKPVGLPSHPKALPMARQSVNPDDSVWYASRPF